MYRRVRRHATYANVVATLALVIAVGGGSAYALQGRNTVFSNDIAPNEVKGKDAREASLKLPRVRVQGVSNPSTAGNEAVTAAATCPAGYSVTGGGFQPNNGVEVRSSFPATFGDNYDRWIASGKSSAAGQYMTAFAVCLKGTTKDPAPVDP